MTYVAGQIPFYSSIPSINRSQDLLEIVSLSSNATYNVTPNNLMGITVGVCVSTTMTQTLQNKTLDNTNALTIKAGSFTVQDSSDTTKQVVLSASGITTGNTRTLTVPDASGTLVLTTATQTLSSKTLTSPAISGGTLDNATVTVDAVSGHTSSNTGTIYGVSITAGLIASAALLGKVNAAALSLSAGVTSYTNTGSGGGTGYYINLGGIKLCWGVSGSFTPANGGNNTCSLPSSFYSTIQYYTLDPINESGTSIVWFNTASTTSTLTSFTNNTSGNSASQAWFVIGT